ncbi:MAG: hypothetical protein EBZ59_07225 [Planctomycetia bacterium]|nr:hypothetical protein [Planctomycetia bacterium]
MENRLSTSAGSRWFRMPEQTDARHDPNPQGVAADDSAVRARRLAGLFCSPVERFGVFRGVRGEDVPEPFRGLLDHHSHMTVAMERFHGGPLGLRIAAVHDGSGPAAAGPGGDGRYSREILLIAPSGRIVQHGIVRLDLGCVDPGVAAVIRAGERPLGRILIDAGLLRHVQRVNLLHVQPGPHLAGLLGLDDGTARPRVTYGRVAEISLAGRPAMELLEIVAPTVC